MKEIILNTGQKVLVDDDDFPEISKYKWLYLANGTGYACRFLNENGKTSCVLMRREIINVKNDYHVDHIDGNGLNNLKENLRICSHQQNQQNKRKSKNNTSGFKGVYWNKEKQKWVSRITVLKRRIFLGYFDSIEKVAHAYDEAVVENFGEFANLNFPKKEVSYQVV